MGPIGLFGIENSGLALAVNLLLLFLVVIWLALVYWTWSDARRRIADPMLVACATAASLFPFIGTVVYLIVRPPEYLEDVRERELEMAAAQARLAQLRAPPLPVLRLRGREGVPALPELPAPPEGAVHRLREAARPALEDLPLLRGRGRAAGRGPPGAPAARHGRQRHAAAPVRGEAGSREPRAPAVGRLMDRTLILVKPDAFEKGLTGEIVARFERKGLRIAAMKHMTVERELAEQHYAEHKERPFFGELVDFITGGPLVALVLEGHEAVKAARQVIGATNPIEAAPGSIRGDYGLEVQTNLVHGSDSPESAQRETGLFFPELG